MSKAFTKETDTDDDLDDDVAALPPGVKNYITPEGLQRMRDEFAHLHQVERPKIVETVAWAASNGDRSENGDYIYGKRRMREIDRRLRFLGRRMAAAVVVEEALQPSDKILFGAKVTVEDEDGKRLFYHIVGED